MDPKVAGDMAHIHWSLNLDQTKDFLGKLFPDKRLFLTAPVTPNVKLTGAPNMNQVLSIMEATQQQRNNHWAFYPDLSLEGSSEENIANFFNGIIHHVPNSHTCTRYISGTYLLICG